MGASTRRAKAVRFRSPSATSKSQFPPVRLLRFLQNRSLVAPLARRGARAPPGRVRRGSKNRPHAKGKPLARSFSTVGVPADRDLMLWPRCPPQLRPLHPGHDRRAPSHPHRRLARPRGQPARDDQDERLRRQAKPGLCKRAAAAEDRPRAGEVHLRLSVREDAGLVPAERARPAGDHGRAHLRRLEVLAREAEHDLLLRDRRPGLRGRVRVELPARLRRPGGRAPRDRIEPVHGSRHADLSRASRGR